MSQSNLLNTIPLEIQYLILDQLNISSAIKANEIIDTDEIYWLRRHKREFANPLKEIEAIDYSIGIRMSNKSIIYDSKLIISKYIIRYSSNIYERRAKDHEKELLVCESNKKILHLKENEFAYNRSYEYKLEYRGVDRRMNRRISIRYHNTIDGDTLMRTTIYPSVRFQLGKVGYYRVPGVR